MIVNGIYKGELATLFRKGNVTLRIENCAFTGKTDRGTPVEGTLEFEAIRQQWRFEAVAHLPPFFVSAS